MLFSYFLKLKYETTPENSREYCHWHSCLLPHQREAALKLTLHEMAYISIRPQLKKFIDQMEQLNRLLWLMISGDET